MITSRARLPIKPPFRVHIDRANSLSFGLVGGWLLLEGSGLVVNDLSGRQANGAITGAAWVNTQQGYGLDFTASTGTYVTVTAATLPSLSGAFSFFVLFRMDALRNWNTIVNKGTSNQPRPFDAWVDSAGKMSCLYGNGAATVVHEATGSTAGTWYTAAGTFTGNVVTSYRNAIQFGQTSSTAPADSTDNLLFGRRVDNGTLLDGQVAAALLYNRALSAVEVQSLHLDPFQLLAMPRQLWTGTGGAPPAPPAYQPRPGVAVGSVTMI